MTAHLVKTRGFIGRTEQAQDAAGVEDCFWSLRTCSASPQCSAESARCHTHGRPGSRPASSFSACRPNGCCGRMAEVVSLAIRSFGSHDMRVRRLPERTFGPRPLVACSARYIGRRGPYCTARSRLPPLCGGRKERSRHRHHTLHLPLDGLKHLRSVRVTLDAGHRTHAVVQAIRRRYWIGRLLKRTRVDPLALKYT